MLLKSILGRPGAGRGKGGQGVSALCLQCGLKNLSSGKHHGKNEPLLTLQYEADPVSSGLGEVRPRAQVTGLGMLRCVYVTSLAADLARFFYPLKCTH